MTKTTLLIATLVLCTAANFVRLSAQEPDKVPPADSVAADPSPELPPDKIVPSLLPDPMVSEFSSISDLKPEEVPSADATVDDFTTPPPVIDEKPAEIDFTTPPPLQETPAPADSITGFTVTDDLSTLNPLPPDVPQPIGVAESFDGRKPGPQADAEAVIDMSEVFRRSIDFASETERLRAEIAAADKQMQDMQATLHAQQQLLNETEGGAHDELQRQIVELQVEMELLASRTQDSVKQAEAEIYLNTYRRVRAVIADYARENGIHTVRRVRAAVSEENMDAEAILEWINRDIVYSADEPRDITQDIVDRLNEATQQGPSASPYGTLEPGDGAPIDGYPVPTTTTISTPPYGSPTPVYIGPSDTLGPDNPAGILPTRPGTTLPYLSEDPQPQLPQQ
jgi:Skp family chaperone for outer membrane proteins